MDKRIERLKEINRELHDIANSFAGNVTGTAAASLHGAGGRVVNVIRMLETGITADDKKDVLREHFKNSIFNKDKSSEEIEELVEHFQCLGAWQFLKWLYNSFMILSYRDVIKTIKDLEQYDLLVPIVYANGNHTWIPVDKKAYVRQLRRIDDLTQPFPCLFEVERDRQMFIHPKAPNGTVTTDTVCDGLTLSQ